MRRFAFALLLSTAALSACTSMVDSVGQSASAKLQRFISTQFSERLMNGIGFVIDELAVQGGFLEDPLVRILLPPPLGMVLGTAAALHNDPEAKLLETLINQAAENAIPGAGPILSQTLANVDPERMQALFEGGDTAATDFLREEAGAAVKAALMPAITSQLQANGAVELYSKMADAKSKVDAVSAGANDIKTRAETLSSQVETQQKRAKKAVATASTVSDDQSLEALEAQMAAATELALTSQEPAKEMSKKTSKEALRAKAKTVEPKALNPEQLSDYVAEQAVAGLFKKVAAKEASIHRSLEGSL